MSRQRVGGILYIAVAVLCIGMAFSEPHFRALNSALAAVFLILGVSTLRRRQPPTGTPGA
jgi:hypothetical protein